MHIHDRDFSSAIGGQGRRLLAAAAAAVRPDLHLHLDLCCGGHVTGGPHVPGPGDVTRRGTWKLELRHCGSAAGTTAERERPRLTCHTYT